MLTHPEILSYQRTYRSIFAREICEEEAEQQGLQLIMFLEIILKNS